MDTNIRAIQKLCIRYSRLYVERCAIRHASSATSSSCDFPPLAEPVVVAVVPAAAADHLHLLEDTPEDDAKAPKTPRLAAAAASASAKLRAPQPPNKPLPPPRRYTNPPRAYGTRATELESCRCEHILNPVPDNVWVSKVQSRFSCTSILSTVSLNCTRVYINF